MYQTYLQNMLLLQIKAANKLLKIMPQNAGCKRVDGVPVFSAENLDIAIATTDGIKWCVISAIFWITLDILYFLENSFACSVNRIRNSL